MTTDMPDGTFIGVITYFEGLLYFMHMGTIGAYVEIILRSSLRKVLHGHTESKE